MCGCCYCSAVRGLDLYVSLMWPGYVMQCGMLMATAFNLHNKPFLCPLNFIVY
jgi:hypothetical protein